MVVTPSMDKKQQFNLWYVALAFAGILLLQGWWQTYRTVEPLAYSDYLALLKKGEITEVTVSQNTIEGKFKTAQNGKEFFTTTRVEPDIANDLAQNNVKFSGQVSDGFLSTLLSWIVPVLFFFALYMPRPSSVTSTEPSACMPKSPRPSAIAGSFTLSRNARVLTTGMMMRRRRIGR